MESMLHLFAEMLVVEDDDSVYHLVRVVREDALEIIIVPTPNAKENIFAIGHVNYVLDLVDVMVNTLQLNVVIILCVQENCIVTQHVLLVPLKNRLHKLHC